VRVAGSPDHGGLAEATAGKIAVRQLNYPQEIRAGPPLLCSLELIPSLQAQGELLYLTFRAHREGKDALVGTDTFVIRDEHIQIHTFYATTQAQRPTTGPEHPLQGA
jgi:hypothetical protein